MHHKICVCACVCLCVFSHRRITSSCMPSTFRTSCIQTTRTPWCQEGNLWPSPTSPGSSSNNSTPHITTPAMLGRERDTRACAQTHTTRLEKFLLPLWNHKQCTVHYIFLYLKEKKKRKLWLKKRNQTNTHALFRMSFYCLFVFNYLTISRFFTYGDLPLEQHLKQIEEEALSKFERIDPNTEVPPQPHWSSPVSPQIWLLTIPRNCGGVFERIKLLWKSWPQ